MNKIEKTVTRSVAVRALTEEMIQKRQAEFVISSESVDTYGTVFRMAGWKLDRYRSNPVVLYNHNAGSSDPDDVIGLSEVFEEDGLLIGRATFEEGNSKAEKVYDKIKRGTLRMASIRANIIKGHWGDRSLGEDPEVVYFDEQELVEWSVVVLGSNPDAHKRNMESLNEIKDIITKDLPVVDPVIEQKRLTITEAQLINNQNLLR